MPLGQLVSCARFWRSVDFFFCVFFAIEAATRELHELAERSELSELHSKPLPVQVAMKVYVYRTLGLCTRGLFGKRSGADLLGKPVSQNLLIYGSQACRAKGFITISSAL